MRSLRRLVASREGVSAVEFALVAPVLLGLFMGAVELPRAIATGKRLSLAVTAMADLVAGAPPPSLEEVFDAAQAVAAPYDVSRAGIVLTAVGIYQVGNAFVARACSSAQRNDRARTPGEVLGPAPAGSDSHGARYVMAEIQMRYTALFPIFPVLNGRTFSHRVVWPVREGQTYFGQPEVVLAGGRPCPAV